MKTKFRNLEELYLYIQHALNIEEIYHFMHSYNQDNKYVFFYVSPSFHDFAFKLFKRNIICTSITRGIDEDGEYWIQINL